MNWNEMKWECQTSGIVDREMARTVRCPTSQQRSKSAGKVGWTCHARLLAVAKPVPVPCAGRVECGDPALGAHVYRAPNPFRKDVRPIGNRQQSSRIQALRFSLATRIQSDDDAARGRRIARSHQSLTPPFHQHKHNFFFYEIINFLTTNSLGKKKFWIFFFPNLNWLASLLLVARPLVSTRPPSGHPLGCLPPPLSLHPSEWTTNCGTVRS